jgi:hypothetical protein
MGNYVIEVGNYVIATPSELGNYMIADNLGLRHVGYRERHWCDLAIVGTDQEPS